VPEEMDEHTSRLLVPRKSGAQKSLQTRRDLLDIEEEDGRIAKTLRIRAREDPKLSLVISGIRDALAELA